MHKKKTISYIFIITVGLFVLASVPSYSQNYLASARYALFPQHPLMEQQIYVRLKADSAERKIYDIIERKEVFVKKNNYLVVCHSEDSLYEAVTNIVDGGGILWADHCFYFPNQKLDYIITGSVPYYTYFEYDEKGRHKYTTSYLAGYDETGEYGTDHLYPDKERRFELITYTYLDNDVIWTDSSYIHTTYRKWHRWQDVSDPPPYKETIEIDTITNEYVFDKQQRLIRAGDMRYRYLDNGGFVLITMSDDKTQLYEDYYNSDGIYIKKLMYSQKSGVWDLKRIIYHTFYVQSIPMNTEKAVQPDLLKVYAVQGGILVSEDTAQPVQIYSLNGSLVKELRASQNQLIPLPRGFYIVSIQGKTCKTIVR